MSDPDVDPHARLVARRRPHGSRMPPSRSPDPKGWRRASPSATHPASPIVTIRMDGRRDSSAGVALNKAYSVTAFKGMPTHAWWPLLARRSGPGARVHAHAAARRVRRRCADPIRRRAGRRRRGVRRLRRPGPSDRRGRRRQVVGDRDSRRGRGRCRTWSPARRCRRA